MKKLLIFLMILSLAIITGCKTTKQDKIDLPPRPQRKYIELPATMTAKDYVKLLNYYEHLVQEWEAWADMVEGSAEQ